MKNFTLERKAFYLTFVVILFACSFPRTAFSQASTTTVNDFIPFVRTIFVPCANDGAGEFVQISGTIHAQSHSIMNGNRGISKSHAQTQGTTGVGLTTGDLYHEVRMFQFSQNSPVVDGASSFGVVAFIRLIGQGPDNNIQVRQLIHFQTNANGEISVSIENFSTDCN